MSILRMLLTGCCLLFISMIPAGTDTNTGFREAQLQYARVKAAKAASEAMWRDLFNAQKIDFPSGKIYYRAFKDEMLFEVWVANNNGKYVLLKEYEICRMSGKLGPKRQEGDLQVPEGFYHIGLFNPWSSFYLSFEVTYPNASDKILGVNGRLGGDIYVHGKCATIGCLPMTDARIKALYWLAVLAKDKGQTNIPIHIFPFKMDDDNYEDMIKKYRDDPNLISFWKNLKEGYDQFKTRQKVPNPKVNNTGSYVF